MIKKIHGTSLQAFTIFFAVELNYVQCRVADPGGVDPNQDPIVKSNRILPNEIHPGLFLGYIKVNMIEMQMLYYKLDIESFC